MRFCASLWLLRLIQYWPFRCPMARTMTDLINLLSLLDDAKCYELVRQHRRPEGVRCPRCNSCEVVRNGRDDTQPYRQRYLCRGCQDRFDDLTGTVLAGHHQPLRVWVLCLYFMGLNLSNQQIAKELALNDDDVQAMTSHLRQGLVAKTPEVTLKGEVEADEVYVVAGHKGNPAAVQKKVAQDGADASREHTAVARSKRRSRRSSG